MANVDAGTIIPPGGYSAPTSGSTPDVGMALVISNILGFMTLIAGLAFLFYFIFGAINWITSAGDPKKLETARQTIMNALIGLVITVIAYPAITIISHLMGVDLLHPSQLIQSFFP